MWANKCTIKGSPQPRPMWPVDLNAINVLPETAIVATVQAIDLTQLAPEHFRAIVQMIDAEAKRRLDAKKRGIN